MPNGRGARARAACAAWVLAAALSACDDDDARESPRDAAAVSDAAAMRDATVLPDAGNSCAKTLEEFCDGRCPSLEEALASVCMRDPRLRAQRNECGGWNLEFIGLSTTRLGYDREGRLRYAQHESDLKDLCWGRAYGEPCPNLEPREDLRCDPDSGDFDGGV